MDEIGDKLFRRMREYLRFYRAEKEGTGAEEYLDELLYILNQEDVAREPYSIAMTWLLVICSIPRVTKLLPSCKRLTIGANSKQNR